MDLRVECVREDKLVRRDSGARSVRPAVYRIDRKHKGQRGKRVPDIVSVGLSARILASVSAARSQLVPSNGDRLWRLRSSSSNCASRHA
eukprot:3171802-Pleurochrysis_carterae.AAC.1